jgi:hypothetical protein
VSTARPPAPRTEPAPADRPLVDVPAGPRSRLGRFLHDYRYPLGVWALSRVLVLVVVGGAGWVSRPRGDWSWSDVVVSPFSAWDAIWYLKIAAHGYDPLLAHGNSPAFFPLYPLTVRALDEVLPVAGLAASGVVASTVLFAVVCVLLWRLTLERFGEALARRTVTYLAIFPLAFVFSAVYTESLFLTFTLASFLMLERGRVWGASTFGALAVLTRPVGVLLAPAIAWRVWSDAGRPWRFRGDPGRRVSWSLARRLAPVALLPLAQVAFQVYLYLVTGQVFATGAAESRGWGREVDVMLVLELPVAWVAALHEAFLGASDMDLVVSGLFASIWAWLLIEAVWRRRLPGEYLIFSGGCLVLAALTGTYLGIPRFFVVAFPLFWLMAMHGRNEHVDHALRSAMPALLAVLAFVAYSVGTFTP